VARRSCLAGRVESHYGLLARGLAAFYAQLPGARRMVRVTIPLTRREAAER